MNRGRQRVKRAVQRSPYRRLGEAHPAPPVSLGNKRSYRTQCADPGEIMVPVGATHEVVKTLCGKCAHCRWVRRSALTNAAERESYVSDWVILLTLTVAPDPERERDRLDVELSMPELQKFQKRVRINKDRGKGSFAGRLTTGWRYIQAGEYGPLRGRAHYHVLVFGRGDLPDWQYGDDVRFDLKEWPHGHANAQLIFEGQQNGASRGAAWYVAKYMTKSHKDGEERCFSRSSAPAIGAQAVYEWGAEVAAMGAPVPTHDFKVSVPGVGRNHSALLLGASREWYLRGFMSVSGHTFESLLDVMPVQTHRFLRRMEKKDREKAQAVAGIEQFMETLREELRSRAAGMALTAEREAAKADDARIAALPVMVPLEEWIPEGWRMPEDVRRRARASNAALLRLLSDGVFRPEAWSSVA